jgi:hypothetical protein
VIEKGETADIPVFGGHRTAKRDPIENHATDLRLVMKEDRGGAGPPPGVA